MNKIVSKIAAVAASAALVVGLAACGASSSSSDASTDDSSSEASYTLVQDGKLTVVAELGFAPFEYIDGDGNTVGFDVDMANEVASRLGLTCEFLPSQQFDTIVPMIKQGGKADVAVTAMTITDERLESVDFSDPYLASNQALITLASSDATEESLNADGMQITCQAGNTGEAWIKENLPNATVVPLADVTAGLMGVQTGLYNAMVVDLPVATNMLSQSFSDLKVAEEIPTGEQYGIAVSKDNPGLTKAINQALADMQSDGTMAQIETKWFGSEI